MRCRRAPEPANAKATIPFDHRRRTRRHVFTHEFTVGTRDARSERSGRRSIQPGPGVLQGWQVRQGPAEDAGGAKAERGELRSRACQHDADTQLSGLDHAQTRRFRTGRELLKPRPENPSADAQSQPLPNCRFAQQSGPPLSRQCEVRKGVGALPAFASNHAKGERFQAC